MFNRWVIRPLPVTSELPGIGQLIARILARASVGRVVIYPPNGLGDSNDLYNEAGQSNQRKALSAIRARINRAPYLISVLGQLRSLEKRF